jgi:asparagine synthase (glutamine-hydrolysing)
MCGICGIFNFDPQRPVERRDLEAMNRAIVHRGPDDDGFYYDRNMGMAMRRLSIIDIAGGRQPMFNEDGTVAVVFNGEIYNFAELRTKLLSLGHTLKTRSDTEVLVHLYEEYGERLMEQCNGMFVFAIYDSKQRRVLLVRDRLGVKPLYYRVDADRLIFGSEIKSFQKLPPYLATLDEEALHHYLTFRFVPAPQTIYRNVKKLEPGHFLDIRCGATVEPRRYWDVDFSSSDGARSLAEAAEQIRALVEDAVKARLIAEVPLGMMLSGGIDSAVITAAMSRATPNGISTFTVDYEEEGPHREGVYARLVAEAFGTSHHEIIVGFRDFMGKLGSMVYYMDEPVADPAAIPVFDLCKFSKNYVTVLLSGIGGDEIYGGYGAYQEALIRRRLGAIPRWLWRCGAPLCPRGLPGRNFIRRLGYPVEKVFLGSSPIYGGLSEIQKQELYTPEFRERQKGLDSHAVIQATLARSGAWSDLHKMMYVDIKHWLADSHLIMMDKMSMATSLELRTPLLDYRLVEQAARLPERFTRTARESKIAFKQAFAPVIPAAVLNRKKRGFSTPLDSWFVENGKEIHDYLVTRRSHIQDYFQKQAITTLFQRHNAGQGDHSPTIFMLLVLELWIKGFCKESH